MLPSEWYVTGRGVQSSGVRVDDDDDAIFIVHTPPDADPSQLEVRVVDPQLVELDLTISAVHDADGGRHRSRCSYRPATAGAHVVSVAHGGRDFVASPFAVDVGIRADATAWAYGPGLAGGLVGHPACFTVETGETNRIVSEYS